MVCLSAILAIVLLCTLTVLRDEQEARYNYSIFLRFGGSVWKSAYNSA